MTTFPLVYQTIWLLLSRLQQWLILKISDPISKLVLPSLGLLLARRYLLPMPLAPVRLASPSFTRAVKTRKALDRLLDPFRDLLWQLAPSADFAIALKAAMVTWQHPMACILTKAAEKTSYQAA